MVAAAANRKLPSPFGVAPATAAIVRAATVDACGAVPTSGEGTRTVKLRFLVVRASSAAPDAGKWGSGRSSMRTGPMLRRTPLAEAS
jgi:hypothetical protein